MSLAQLRTYRACLQAEARRTAHRRRLTRARLDLLLAQALPGAFVDPPGAWTDSPDVAVGVVLAGSAPAGATDPVTCLVLLRELADRLRCHDDAVRAAMEEATAELVRRYSQEPGRCLVAVPRHG